MSEDRGVRGAHYDTGTIEHWDWVSECGLGYFDGSATAYVVRWKNKGGLEDLQKALSYVHKLLSIVKKKSFNIYTPVGDRTAEMFRFTRQICRAYHLDADEEEIVYGLLCWKSPSDLQRVADMLREMIAVRDIPNTFGESKPVPLEEENHYSERANDEQSTDRDESTTSGS